jgi:hypothetical protein
MQCTQQLRADYIKKEGGIQLRCNSTTDAKFQAFFLLVKQIYRRECM